ncbi:hypothetical protein ACQKLX_21170 [Bosea sp. NPDC003192]|uniref:hypothetical protein n=1 Tax=Bosea sp. NPDC003192 TaxID=3390551 RepID=UPI003D006C57
MNALVSVSEDSLVAHRTPLRPSLVTGCMLTADQLLELIELLAGEVAPKAPVPGAFPQLAKELAFDIATISAAIQRLGNNPLGRGRGRPPEHQLYALRWRKTASGGYGADPMVYEVLPDHERRSTGFRLSQSHLLAGAANLKYKLARAKLIGFTLPTLVAVEDVLDYGISFFGAASVRRRKQYEAVAKPLKAFFAGKVLGDVADPRVMEGYRPFREKTKGLNEDASGNKLPIAASTINAELVFLRRCIGEFALFAGLSWVPRFKGLKHDGPRVSWLKRKEVARLLLACRGWVWDKAKGGWKTQAVFDSRGRHWVFDKQRKRWRLEETGIPGYVERPVLAVHPRLGYRLSSKAVARIIIMGFYTGSRADILLMMRWVRDGRNGYVDFDAGIFYRSDFLYPKNDIKQAGPCKMPPRLGQHMLRWQRGDLANGITWVAHKPDGTGFSSPVSGLLRPLVVRAGLQGYLGEGEDERFVRPNGARVNVTMHIFRHTCATILLQMGVSTAVVAQFLSITQETLTKVYGKWLDNGTLDPAMALQECRLRPDLFN